MTSNEETMDQQRLYVYLADAPVGGGVQEGFINVEFLLHGEGLMWQQKVDLSIKSK